MKQISLILYESFSFAIKYAYDYIKYILKFVLLGILSFIFIPLIQFNPIFALFALFITVPAFCFCFWKGYVATYALNFASFEFFLKKPLQKFETYIELTKKQEGQFAGFVSFFALITIIGYIPTVIYFINCFSFEKILIDPTNAMAEFKPVITFSIINTAVLAQFLNFALQAFFFKKHKENYFALLIKCYTKTGIFGFILSNVIIGLVTFLNIKAPVIYLITFLPLNLVIYSINTFWYYLGIKKDLTQARENIS